MSQSETTGTKPTNKVRVWLAYGIADDGIQNPEIIEHLKDLSEEVWEDFVSRTGGQFEILRIYGAGELTDVYVKRR